MTDAPRARTGLPVARRMVGAAVAGALLLVLAACGVVVPAPGTFDDLDRTVARLDPQSMGTVERVARFGGVRLGPAYILVVVSGSDAREKLDATLTDSGFSAFPATDGNPVEWESPDGWDSVTVEVRSVAAGDQLPLGAGDAYVIEDDGAAFYVTR